MLSNSFNLWLTIRWNLQVYFRNGFLAAFLTSSDHLWSCTGSSKRPRARTVGGGGREHPWWCSGDPSLPYSFLTWLTARRVHCRQVSKGFHFECSSPGSKLLKASHQLPASGMQNKGEMELYEACLQWRLWGRCSAPGHWGDFTRTPSGKQHPLLSDLLQFVPNPFPSCNSQLALDCNFAARMRLLPHY